jgi:hypothetical protein
VVGEVDGRAGYPSRPDQFHHSLRPRAARDGRADVDGRNRTPRRRADDGRPRLRRPGRRKAIPCDFGACYRLIPRGSRSCG